MTNINSQAQTASVYTNADATALRCETVVVTPAMARALRADCHFERQRPINLQNVSRLALEMQRGWFIRGTPIYICVMPDGSMNIVNGNHTLEAVSASGVSVPLTFIYNQVPDIEAASRVYANSDLQKVRTWRTALQAVKGDATQFQGHMLSALGFLMSDFLSGLKTPDGTSRTARFGLLGEYEAVGETLRAAMHGGVVTHQRAVRRVAVLAVALVTARYQPATAAEPWGGMVFDDGLKVGDPRRALIRYLGNNPSLGTGNRPIRARAAAGAWNAFFAGREMDVVKPSLSNGVRILGTAWHKGPPNHFAAPVVSTEVQAVTPPSSKPMFETGMGMTNGATHPVARFVG